MIIMVSKIAVMAIVGIIAVPILLGYALNLEQTTETDYRDAGDSVNVTPLLQSDVGYTYAHPDIFQMNSTFTKNDVKIDPTYESYTNTASSIKMGHKVLDPSDMPAINYPLSHWSRFYVQFDYDYNTTYRVVLSLMDNNITAIAANSYVTSVYYDIPSGYLEVSYYVSEGSMGHTRYSIGEDANRIYTRFSYIGTYAGTAFMDYLYADGTVDPTDTLYADAAAGYRFNLDLLNRPGIGYEYTRVVTNIPDYAKSILFTVDLSSVTDASYELYLGKTLTKTTTDGVVKWTVSGSGFDPFDLYYDQTSTNNTYQILFSADPNGWSVGSGIRAYDMHTEFRYVGAWPSLIGEANYYQLYEVDTVTTQVGDLNLSEFSIRADHELTPIIRVDDAEYRAFEYPVILDATYDPASFKINPSTTINNPTIYGHSIEFGGNTYVVKNGNITIGTHQVAVKGLVLSSVPNGNGEYDNKIGDTVISTTAAPSAITFNGKWSASISTVAQEEYEYTKTEWIAGGFAWDGMDQSFLMVGLITSLGMFIALGIYARRSRASVWPLMLVCGGAAALFFIML